LLGWQRAWGREAPRWYLYAARRRIPLSGVLSEGEKRDSKGGMPELFSRLARTTGEGGTAAEATLLRSQRLGLGRGGPTYAHARVSAFLLVYQTLDCWGCRGTLGLAGRVCRGTVVLLVALFPKPTAFLFRWLLRPT